MIRASLFLLLATGPATAEAVWEFWSRPDSPVVIDVPDHLFDVRAKTPARDRIVWETVSGDIALEAFVLDDVFGRAPAAVADARLTEMPERIVTYRTGGDSWVVISGYQDATERTIFYDRFETDGARWVGLSLVWDVARRDDVDDLIDRIANSLALR